MGTKHTPGPWRVHAEKPNIVDMQSPARFGGGNVYAACGGRYRDGNSANARLIAAAPELLAALVECEKQLRAMGCVGHADVAKSKIAKAKGE